MTANHASAHAAPHSTRYLPEPVNFARRRKPNRRRGIVWQLDGLASVAFCRLGERMMRDR
jgi:hypothetical protein